MSNIIQFPRGDSIAPAPVPIKTRSVAPAKTAGTTGKAILSRLTRFITGFIWVAIILMWPILKRVLFIDLAFQFMRMIYHWKTPDMHAGWTFLVHVAVAVVVICFVLMWKPK